MSGLLLSYGTVVAVAPTVVNTNTSLAGSGNPVVSLPASLVSGNKILIEIGISGAATLATPSGWNLVGTATTGSGISDRRIYVFDKTSDGTEGASVTITITGSSANAAITYQINGSASATQIATATGAGTNPDPGNLNIGTTAPTLWIAGATKRESVDASGAPSGYGSLLVSRSTNLSDMSAVLTSTASSQDPGAFSGFSVSDNWSAVTLGLRT